MAVETVGMVYNQALKSSEGSEDWLTFFQMCSAIVSHTEGGVVIPQYVNVPVDDLRSMIEQYASEHTFFTKLSSIKTVQDIVYKSSQNWAYCILKLNVQLGRSTIYPFKSDQFDLANGIYTMSEQSSLVAGGKEFVVLISTEDLKNLNMLYPSYFLDVAKFRSMIQNFLQD